MPALSDKANRELLLTCLFGAFVFLQFTVLGLANHAGEGYLATEQRNLVYYALQVFVIGGFLLYALFYRFCTGKRIRSAAAYGGFAVFVVCVAVMLLIGPASLGSVIVSMAAALCVGGIGGAAHLRMSMATVVGDGVARCMGIGSAVAVVMQYLLQIQWGVAPLLPVFMLAATGLLLFLLLRIAPETDAEGSGGVVPTPSRRISVAVVIAATFILFTGFYNEHIHHLMIQSDYASYTVYSWPRLMLVPGYLLFAAIGDRRGGKYVPIASLCIMLVALLNVVLIGEQGAYWLNMCLFYLAIAAFTSYYLLTFWRLAPGTRNPALWAPFGRMLDSAMVLVAGAINLSALSAPVILGLDVAGVALVIIMMALGGDFNLAQAPSEPEEPEPSLSLEERTRQLARECNLTERESEVLVLLVLTEDKNQLIADKLGISRRQVQTYISRIYEKTGAASRANLIMRASGDSQPRESS
ncbi:MAG: helix-turn-helix transcriptional regulator [Eggerthellaceae bacterium]|nr:helix-turn-helix transcriptional regulator [Eggerthellaceae bacterium]